ncbi:MAG: DUF4870 domain-containing protein [Acidobacteria bacterium]|nr:DUF4870 domain-containing protein [Acidobacteriota bacterium]
MQDTPPASDTPESPPPSPPSQQESSNRTVMLILSYLGILALVPLLVEKDDPEVQWHAKHGLVLLVSWIVLFIALAILSSFPFVGMFLGCAVAPLLWLVILFIHIVAMIKALKGERLIIPVISDYADKWS